jgi:hypothetical protein
VKNPVLCGHSRVVHQGEDRRRPRAEGIDKSWQRREKIQGVDVHSWPGALVLLQQYLLENEVILLKQERFERRPQSFVTVRQASHGT